MIEKREYKITKGPKILVDTIVCDHCGNFEPLESVQPYGWTRTDDVKGAEGSVRYFDSAECLSAYYAESATPGE